MMEEHYQPSGACLGCPYRTRCHDARKRVQDPRGIGRHTSCEFHASFERLAIPTPERKPFRINWALVFWSALRGSGR